MACFVGAIFGRSPERRPSGGREAKAGASALLVIPKGAKLFLLENLKGRVLQILFNNLSLKPEVSVR